MNSQKGMTEEFVVALHRAEPGSPTTHIEPFAFQNFRHFSELLCKRPTTVMPDKDYSKMPYFVRGGELDGTVRNNDNLISANLLILDIDHAKVGESAEPPKNIHTFLDGLSVDHLIYTSYSHTSEIPRYRICLPMEYTKDEVEPLTFALHAMLSHKFNIKFQVETMTWSQAWYFGALKSAESVFESYVSYKSMDYNVELKETLLKNAKAQKQKMDDEIRDNPEVLFSSESKHNEAVQAILDGTNIHKSCVTLGNYFAWKEMDKKFAESVISSFIYMSKRDQKDINDRLAQLPKILDKCWEYVNKVRFGEQDMGNSEGVPLKGRTEYVGKIHIPDESLPVIWSQLGCVPAKDYTHVAFALFGLTKNRYFFDTNGERIRDINYLGRFAKDLYVMWRMKWCDVEKEQAISEWKAVENDGNQNVKWSTVVEIARSERDNKPAWEDVHSAGIDKEMLYLMKLDKAEKFKILNSSYATIKTDSGTFILRREAASINNKRNGRESIQYVGKIEREYSLRDFFEKEVDFKTYHRNDTVYIYDKDASSNKRLKEGELPGRLKRKKLSELWLDSSDRIKYEKHKFEPLAGQIVNNLPFIDGKVYNSFKGLHIKPIEGDCKLFLKHIKEVICNNRLDIFEWVMDWIANMYQNPHERAGTALVLQGAQGIGKGMFTDVLQDSWGPHGILVSGAGELAAKFNHRFKTAIFLHANESTWGGLKKDEGVLKNLVTDEFIVTEQKFMDAEMTRNCTHICISSNDKWAVPIEIGDRRFMVLDVVDKYKGDAEYFKQLRNHLEEGGAAAFVHYCLSRDIKNNPKQLPNYESELKTYAIKRGATPVMQWMIDALENDQFYDGLSLKDTLMNGEMYNDEISSRLSLSKNSISTRDLQASFEAWQQHSGIKHKSGRITQTVLKHMGGYMPLEKKWLELLQGKKVKGIHEAEEILRENGWEKEEFIAKNGTTVLVKNGHLKKIDTKYYKCVTLDNMNEQIIPAEYATPTGKRVIKFNSLEFCRAMFEEMVGEKIEWDI